MPKKSNNLPEKLPEEAQSETSPVQEIETLLKDKNKLSIILQELHTYSGPLPHPQLLKQYDECVPGSANRIIKMAEKQMAHRHKIEDRSLEYSHKQITKGQILGFFICFLSLASGTLCALKGAIIPGSLFGTAGVAGLAAVFVYGSRRKEKAIKEQQ